ncbi:T9SS type B sorting domain-containing protein [Parvicella tangerina]|uniref:Uncharacterized protein n=1 Tax=Parvicella tangerina TaxID=2829795 RepID=A0A916JP26_9FLAO|nr:gliding motility-associated C-terminal domain-containing protein [Parvicella tangerina]CAG5083344.1 hypothetical protein CRYO30217_02169 [Parvicella tangerina]
MNKHVLLGVFLWALFSLNIHAQQVQGKDGIITNPESMPSTFMGETVRLSSLPIDTTLNLPITKQPKIGYHDKDDWIVNPTVNPNALPKNGDPILQKDYNTIQNRSTQVGNWAGITTTTNPGDPTVDVGPNHVVQMMNGSSGARVQIWDKSGNTLAGPVNFSTLSSGGWSGLGDPIVLYDERADRWILTEFCNGCNDMYIAISTTPDPTGTYNTFSVTANSFPDYPKYSIWDNSYLITANEGTTTSSVYILDRTAMLAGGAPNAQRFTVPRFGTIGFQATTPVSLLGTAPSGSPAMLMRMRDDAWTGSASDALEIWELDIDWSNPGAATLSQTYTLPVSPFESELCGFTSFSCIPQPGGNDLDPLRELLMNRIMYRNFGSYEALVCAHVTDVDGTDHAGIRWYELRNTGSGWTIYQEGTYSPDAENRWMPTIGLSASGNIGLAYNVSSTSTHPEIRYTGRKECDPLGVMTETEVQLVDGTSNNNSNRWGDYNQMGVDPSDGETFWFTAMYNPNAQARTRVGAFTIDPCNPQVQFDNSTYSVNESDANTANGCLDYYTLDVPISIGIDPSQPADITVNVSGGSATQNVDYSISNANLTLDGSTLTGSVQVLIYNDNNTEGDETIILDYTLNANGGDATTGTINQTVTITIVDDDLDPLSMPGVTTTIYSEDFESGFGGVTTTNVSGATAFQLGNTGTTPNGAYNIPTDNTTQFAWIDDDDCNCNMNEVYLYLPSQDLSNYLSANITFDSYFEDNTYGGNNENADLVVSTDGGATFTTIAPLVASGIDVSWTQQSFDVSAYVGNSDVIFAIQYSDAGGWLYGCSVDNFELTGVQPIDIQTAVNTGSGQTANLGPNETVHFYDPTSGDVMMSIVNTSSFDYGCVTVEVDRDGTTPTALEFASATVSDYLHGKTYTVAPTNNNPSGTFDVTLYYKEAEVSAWETITGNNRNNLEIVKVAGNNAINDVTPANYTSYTIDNISATLGSFYSDVTLTASFTNGFSGFGAGIYNVTTVTVTHTASGVDPQCNGASDGSITFTPSGGTGPYEFSVDGGATWTSSNPVTGLAGGTYSTVVRDAGLNQSTPVSITLTDPAAINMSSSATNPNCSSGTGSITVTASGGTGTLQYSIDGGSTFQAGGSFTGLASGTYNIVVEDVNGCQATGSESIAIPTAINMSSSATSPNCSSGTGSITVTASGGTGSLQYSIDGGSTFQAGGSFTGLASGTYNIVVEDANNCQATGSESITIPTAVTVSSSSTVENCGNNDGSITISASGGTGAIQYSINGGSSFLPANTFNSLASGTYNIVVEDANGCQASTTETIGLNTGPTITSVSDTDPTCFGGNNGSITFSAAGVGTLQYSINGGSSWQPSNNFTGLSSGTYNLLIQDGAGCQLNVGTLTLNDPSQITYTASSTNEICGNGDGTLTLTAAGGSGSLQYSIDGGTSFQSGNSFSSLSAGNYNIVIQDALGCQTSGTENIGSTGGPTISNETSTDITCSGSTDGTITITASGTGTLMYSIDGGSSFSATSTFTGLPTGAYDIVVQDGNSCVTNGSTITLSSPSAVTYTATVTDASCGGSDGEIVLAGSGGDGSYQYSINGGSTFQSGGTFSGLSTGSYNIVVQDGSLCEGIGTTSVGSTSGPSISNESSTDVSCNGAADGSINISATGVAPLEYSIDGGSNYSTTSSFTGLSGGNYSVTVRDGNGCVTNGSIININEDAAITYVANISDATCGNNNGTITITASGGVGSYQYSIDGGSSFQSSGIFSGIGSNSYNIVVEDGNSCQTTGIETVNNVGGPSITSETATDISCNGANDGTISVVATGTATLEYSIDGGTTFGTSSLFSGLSAGTYNVVVRDGNSCTTSGTTLTISNPASIIYSASVSDASCGSSNGSITISASGGTGSLQYSIDGGSSFQSGGNFSGLGTGTYNIVVEDANGCQINGTESVGSTSGPSITNEVFTDITCNGDDDGTITISASGSGTLNYSINGGSTFVSSGVFTNLSSGTYNIVVRDGNGCVTNGSTINISEPSVISFTTNITDATCGVNDGEIIITAAGGTGSYQYSIDGGSNFQTGNTFSGIGTGTYSVIVEDANGCQQTSTAVVNSVPGPSIVSSAANDISCFGLTDGNITIVATGISPLSYSIDGVNYQSSGTFTNLDNGTFVVNIQDGNGCVTNTTNLTIGEPSAIAISSSTTDATCGNSDGAIALTATGGTGSLQYSIDGGNNFQPNGNFNAIMAGTYNIVVEDANSCQSTSSVTVINADGPILSSISTSDETCFGANDGSLTVLATGTPPITYSFNGGAYQSSGTYTGSTGNIDIDIQDGNGCILSTSGTINAATAISLIADSQNATCGMNNGSAVVTASGGTGVYSYLWNDDLAQTNNVATNLTAGAYQVVVTDGNGCEDSTSVVISSNSTMTVNVDVTHESCPGEEDGIIATEVTGGQAPYVYNWSNGDSTAVIENLAVGDYTLTVSDDDDCIVTLIIPIENEGGDCIHIPTAISPNGDGANETWVIGGLEDHPNATVEIYNRWGSLLFSSNDYQNDWDGTYNGENVSAGVYYYVIKLDEETTYTGSITVIR